MVGTIDPFLEDTQASKCCYMLEQPGKKIISSQLIELLKVTVLPEESFLTTFDQNVGPLTDEDEMIRDDEFRRLGKATDPLKRSNAVPPAMAVTMIELFQKTCAGDIARDDDYIQHLQSRINGLLEELQATRSRQSRIQKLSDYFKPICSPVRRLPPEILTTIFQFCIPRNVGPRVGAPLVLCHVSSLWRSVALGSQQLWSRLSLNLGQTSVSEYDEIANFWFRNSRNQPLSLHYHQMCYHGIMYGPQLVSKFLKTSSMLLRTLQCIDFRPQHLIPFLRLPSTDVPLLEVVRLVSTRPCNEAITVLEAAPCLRIVHLDMSSSLFQGALPWSQLTWLKINDPMEATHWMVAFQQCLQLQYGSFEVHFSSEEAVDIAPQITLGHLEALYLTVRDDDDLFENFFRNLDLPSLRHFSLTNFLFETSDDMPFCDMTSYPNLVSLCLQGIDMERDDLASLFTETPTLECLALDLYVLDHPSILDLLHKNSAMLPALSHLYLFMSYKEMTRIPEVICSTIMSRFHDSSSSLVSLKDIFIFIQRNEDCDDDDVDFGFTAGDRVDKISDMIQSDPNFGDVKLHMSVVSQTPKLAELVEKIWCEWPQDD